MFQYWGKARPASDTHPEWHPLVYHSLDVAASGKIYLQRHHRLRRHLTHQFAFQDEQTFLCWFTFFLSLHDQIDVAQERERIGRELHKTQAKIVKLIHKLGNPAFVNKAPASVVSKNREELSALEAQSATLDHSLNRLPPSDQT